jgi:cell wall-associated NlpC family hydrolase
MAKNIRKTNSFFTALSGLLGLLLVACSSSPTKPHAYYKKPYLSSSRTALVDYALSLEGAPYRYGKSSPTEGFDCSGFVQHVYGRYGVRLPRTAENMALSMPEISASTIRQGDLVFFNTNGRRYSHVGIVVDKQHFIHASSSRTGRVIVSNLQGPYWQDHFTGVRRP